MVIGGCLEGDTKIFFSKSDISDIQITEKIHKQASTDLKIRKELDSLKYDLKE